jgi:hypothetical protein
MAPEKYFSRRKLQRKPQDTPMGCDSIGEDEVFDDAFWNLRAQNFSSSFSTRNERLCQKPRNLCNR